LLVSERRYLPSKLAVIVVSSSRVRVKTPSEVLKLASSTRARLVLSKKGLKSTVKVVSSSRVNVAVPFSSRLPSIRRAKFQQTLI
jgi:hypothetical protein